MREVVVERRQHLLVQLLERDQRGARGAVAALPADLLGVARDEIANPLLDLLDEALRPELDDVVALARARIGLDVDDGDIAEARGAPVDLRPARH